MTTMTNLFCNHLWVIVDIKCPKLTFVDVVADVDVVVVVVVVVTKYR